MTALRETDFQLLAPVANYPNSSMGGPLLATLQNTPPSHERPLCMFEQTSVLTFNVGHYSCCSQMMPPFGSCGQKWVGKSSVLGFSDHKNLSNRCGEIGSIAQLTCMMFESNICWFHLRKIRNFFLSFTVVNEEYLRFWTVRTKEAIWRF